MSDKTEGARKALNKFFEKAYEEQRREMGLGKAPRRNEAPEMDLVQKPCKTWFRNNGWSMFIIDAKARWSDQAQTFIRADVDPGFSDSVGCTPEGSAAFVEFKAPGRRASLKDHQRQFLEDKIRKGCFAVVVDSVELLATLYSKWLPLSKFHREVFLRNSLPPMRKKPVAETDSDLPF